MSEPKGLQREPVRIATLVGAIMAIVAMMIAFNLLDWTEDQTHALEVALVAALPVAAWIVQWIANEFARARVTPLNSPRDVDGTELTRPDGTPAIKAL